MKIALVGYGKMGRMIEGLAPEHGCSVVARIDRDTPFELSDAEVAIEFSTPEAVRGNLLKLAELGLPTVCGTTGWHSQLSEIRAAFEKRGGTLIYGANFSIGVNIFDRVIREAARLFAAQEQYSAWGWEAHHEQKKDAPSGTLLKLEQTMRSAGYGREIQLSATRAGFIPGTHEIGFDSPNDTITLRHTARSREGFASGALKAAGMARSRKGVFEFSELLFEGARS